MRVLSIIALLALAVGGLKSPAAPARAATDINDYGLAAPGSGWVLTADQLYITQDEGATWTNGAPGLAGGPYLAATFLADGHGWLVADRGADGAGSALLMLRTSDWGAHWASLPLALPGGQDALAAFAQIDLTFTSASTGVLRLRYASSSNFERWSEWRTSDGGATWAAAGARTAAADAASAEDEAVYLANGRDGWRIERGGVCREAGAQRRCQQTTALAATHDGGAVWRGLSLPDGLGGTREWTAAANGAAGNAAVAGGRTAIAAGQGFDKCEIATMDQAAAWRSSSPYSVMNLYIGGSKRACRNSAMNPDYLRTLYAMGWTFIPTWVGPQSACGSLGGINIDPAAAQSQGWSEAQAAADRLASLGLAEGDGSGSIVYYDLEYFGQNESCYPAVQAFVAGWTQALHSRGSLAGLYAHRLNLSHFATLPQPPDAIWAADHYASTYDPAVTVWGIPGLPDDLWIDHQRIRQYTRSHVEGWSGVSLEIDSNVLDAPVALMAVARDTPTPTATLTTTLTPTATPTPTVTPTRIVFTPTGWVYLPILTR